MSHIRFRFIAFLLDTYVWSRAHVRALYMQAGRQAGRAQAHAATVRGIDLQHAATVRDVDLQHAATVRDLDFQHAATVRDVDLQ